MNVALKIEDNLSIEEADLTMDKYSKKKALSSQELGYLLALLFPYKSDMSMMVVEDLIISLYKLYIEQISAFNQEEIEKAMIDEMCSKSGISLIKYACYLKLLGKRPAYVLTKNSSDAALIEMKNFSCLPGNPVGQILGEPEGEFGALLIDLGWPILPIRTLELSEGDIFRKFSLSKDIKDEISASLSYEKFLFNGANVLRFRIKYSVDTEEGFCWLEEHFCNSAFAFPTEDYSKKRNFIHLSRASEVIEKILMNLCIENVYWNSEQYSLLLKYFLSFSGLVEYLFSCHISRQRDKELLAAQSLALSKTEIEKRLSEEIKKTGMPIYRMLAYTVLAGRAMVLAPSKKLGFVFYQVVDERSIEDREGRREDSYVVPSPYTKAIDYPMTHFDATKSVNGRQFNVLDAKAIAPKSFIAAKSLLNAYSSMSRSQKGYPKLSTLLLYRTIFRSFPKGEEGGGYHRFYLRKFKV
jgi:hypothetical protein